MNFTLLDTLTGETKKIQDRLDPVWYAEGNGSCDCNRAPLFGIKSNTDECLGAKRFVITEAETDDFTIQQLNESYPVQEAIL
jgi:hypothetical protein